MPIPVAEGVASFDQSAGEFLDLSNVLATVLLADNFLLGALPFTGQATQTTHSWMEDSLNATSIVQSGGAALEAPGAVLSIVVSAADASFLRIGALLRDEAVDLSEVLQVTNIVGTTVTVTRGFGSTSPQLHAATPTFRVISQPKQEGDTGVNDRSRVRVKKSNYTQIYKDEIIVTGTKIATASAGVPNELNYQIAQRTLELARNLGMTAWHGIKNTAALPGSDTEIRTSGGLREFLSKLIVNGGNHNDTSEAIDESVVNELYTSAWDKGGDPDLGVGSRQQITKFTALNSADIRIAQDSRTRGKFVERYLTDQGKEITLLTDRWINADEFAIIEAARCPVMPLINRNWKMSPLSIKGDRMEAMIIGEFTQECRNADEAHALHSKLT